MKLTPAEYVIFKFGGVIRTAEALGRDKSAISRWLHKPGGLIPNQMQATVLKRARELKIDITAEDLIVGRNVRAR